VLARGVTVLLKDEREGIAIFLELQGRPARKHPPETLEQSVQRPAFNNAWQIWDNPGDGRNPVYNPSKTIKPTAGVVHSWIAMTNDGKLAFIGDSSVIDVKTHKEIAVMKDEFGRRIVHTEKALYMTFRDGKLIETNNQFAVGDAKAYSARKATGTQNQ